MHWLAEMIMDYRKRLMDIEFYQYVKSIKDPSEFKWVRQLLHQATEFPQVLSLRYSLCRNSEYRGYFGIHVDEEIGHAEMLADWMKRHNLLGADENVHSTPITLETINAISYFYRMVLTEDEFIQLVGLNAVSEGVAADFFVTLKEIVDNLDMGDEYWDIHAGLDAEHSTECFDMFPDVDRESPLGQKLAKVVQDSMMLNAYMLNSWIGVHATLNIGEPQLNS